MNRNSTSKAASGSRQTRQAGAGASSGSAQERELEKNRAYRTTEKNREKGRAYRAAELEREKGREYREAERERDRRRERRALERERRARVVRRQRILLAAGLLTVLLAVVVGTRLVSRAYADSNLSEGVLAYRDMMEKYAKKAGVSDYVDTLLAIMMVESEGQGKDVMQASESLGLEPGSLEPEASIEQACVYFAALVEMEYNLGIDDDKALIQAYNFGPGYLFYLAENGKKHSQSLAIEYAKEQSGGEKIRYLHLYAIKKNGGWIYKFGNMFYDALVQQYL